MDANAMVGHIKPIHVYPYLQIYPAYSDCKKMLHAIKSIN
jgi:hypothetical protein